MRGSSSLFRRPRRALVGGWDVGPVQIGASVEPAPDVVGASAMIVAPVAPLAPQRAEAALSWAVLGLGVELSVRARGTEPTPQRQLESPPDPMTLQAELGLWATARGVSWRLGRPSRAGSGPGAGQASWMTLLAGPVQREATVTDRRRVSLALAEGVYDLEVHRVRTTTWRSRLPAVRWDRYSVSVSCAVGIRVPVDPARVGLRARERERVFYTREGRDMNVAVAAFAAEIRGDRTSFGGPGWEPTTVVRRVPGSEPGPDGAVAWQRREPTTGVWEDWGALRPDALPPRVVSADDGDPAAPDPLFEMFRSAISRPSAGADRS